MSRDRPDPSAHRTDADSEPHPSTHGTDADSEPHPSTHGTDADSEPHPSTHGTGAVPVREDRPVIRAEGLAKSYGSWLPFADSEPVLDGVDLALYRGEITGIIGANGSGKSTLLGLLAGVLDADAGTVVRHGSVGWCPQESLLYDRLTVAETVRLFGEAYGLADEAITAARDRLADRLEFGAYLDYRVEDLSGGNRQKLNLAVALLHDPDVLLLDEPYTGFDWETYLAFWDLAEELAADGTGVAVVSHLVHDEARFDRIYELHEGRLREGSHGR